MGKKTVRGHDIANRFVYSLTPLSKRTVEFTLCAEHGTNLAGASPATGIYRQV